MGLQQQLDAFQARWAETTPADRVALYAERIEALRREFAGRHALGAGDAAPDFALPGADGRIVRLSALLAAGPAVVTFYRGGWCPYCNIQLRAYQAALPDIVALGARLVAVSPQRPDASGQTAEANGLGFDVLSDAGNVAGRAFGLVWTLPEDLRAAMRAGGKALPEINGDASWELPVPATYVIAPDRRIALVYVEVDHRRRLEPARVLSALGYLRSSAAKAAA